MSDEWTGLKCRERAGFLFSHKCDKTAKSRCKQCNKPICTLHTVQGEMLLCTTCGKRSLREHGPTQRGEYRENPYFYSYYHYPSYHTWHSHRYHHDSSDFTDGDEAGFDGGDGDFSESYYEDDMGGS